MSNFTKDPLIFIQSKAEQNIFQESRTSLFGELLWANYFKEFPSSSWLSFLFLIY